MRRFKSLFTAVVLMGLLACSGQTPLSDISSLSSSFSGLSADDISETLSAEHRSAEAQARDTSRNPAETLAFFGLQPDHTVVEILPGGGWYTDVIAPLVAEKGQYYAAGYSGDIEGQPEYRYKLVKMFAEKIAAKPELYGNAEITVLAPPTYTEIAPAGSADLVVSFRSFHGMLREDPSAYLTAIATALKPGGVFGIVQHRADDDATDIEAMGKSGYVSEQTVIDMAKEAGLTLAGKSEINANPRDTKDYADGVWTLPPTLRLGDKDREKYLAIGESDRMTLKFVKGS